MTEHQSQGDTTEANLFSRYLEICNQAMEANKDRFPFKQILAAAQSEQSSKNIEVCIINDNPEGTYVIQLGDNKIIGESHESCDDCECDGQWRVTRSYLEDVVQNPEKYIQNPAKIDWDWMYDQTN